MPTVLQEELAVSHLLSVLRDKRTSAAEFVARTETLATLLIARALDLAPSEEAVVDTPLEPAHIRRIIERDVVGVPILRAGMGMERAFLRLIPSAPVHHIGVRRDEATFEPNYYYDSLPEDLSGKTAIILDPMLATGGSAIFTAKRLSALNPDRIVFCGIIGAPEGVRRLTSEFPDMAVFLGALDERLDENAYIRPGLGDAGDRHYGTT